MSADILCRAAALMRERAEAVAKDRPSPWWVLGADEAPWQTVWYGDEAKVKGIDAGTVPEEEWEAIWATSSSLDASDWDTLLAQHIAGWHPAVALAVADLLDGIAGRHFLVTYSNDLTGLTEGECWYCHRRPCPDLDAALVVARAYLGDDA